MRSQPAAVLLGAKTSDPSSLRSGLEADSDCIWGGMCVVDDTLLDQAVLPLGRGFLDHGRKQLHVWLGEQGEHPVKREACAAAQRG